MEEKRLAGLKPESVFGYFEEICRIPHGSGNVKMISDYLARFAREHDLDHFQDSLGNVVIFQPGTPGYETHEPVILQGHMDMVCEKDPDCPLDMEKDGLDVGHDGEWVFAKGTTLGGDDGIAIAYSLALLADSTIPHPPLEVIITVDEETGMDGAAALDASGLKGRRMVNLDSEDEGLFTVSCAGGANAKLHLPGERKVVYGPCVRVKVDGLRGGHSGAEIDKNRANANKVMGLLLSRIQELMPICLTSLRGGTKDNAIPRSCEAKFIAMGMHLERINGIAQQLQEEVRRDFDEPYVTVEAFDVDALGGNAVSAADSAKMIGLMCALPNGVQAMSEKLPGLVQTSLNLGVAELAEQLNLTCSVRSSVNEEKEALLDKLDKLTEFYGGTSQRRGEYPAWEYRDDSPLRDVMVETFREQYGYEPEIAAIHAGLECGLLGGKIPGLDCVSIGPQMQDIHTSRERLKIDSVERTWNLLLSILKKL